MNSTFHACWSASSEVISQILFTSVLPKKNKIAFVSILSQIKLLFGPLVIQVVWYIILYYTGLLVGCRKKSQFSRDIQGQIRGKNGQFRGNFAEIFEASFVGKRLVKNGRFRESFPSKFRWKAIGFVLIWGKFSMKLDAFIAFPRASYRNMKLYFTSKLIEHIKTNKRIRILKTHLLF